MNLHLEAGAGVLDGGAPWQNWWSWKNYPQGRPYFQTPDRERLFENNRAGTLMETRIFGAGHLHRPSFIQPYRCRKILIEGATLRKVPFRQIHPVFSTNIPVRGVTVLAAGPNTDGCEPESCRDVLNEDCHFETGDD